MEIINPTQVGSSKCINDTDALPEFQSVENPWFLVIRSSANVEPSLCELEILNTWITLPKLKSKNGNIMHNLQTFYIYVAVEMLTCFPFNGTKSRWWLKMILGFGCKSR